MEASTAIRRPAPALRLHIDRYLGYRMAGLASGLHRGLPSRHLTCIISIGDPIDVVAQADPGQAPERYGFVVGGLQTSPALIAHPGRQEGIALELTPTGARAVFGVPAGALWRTSVEASDVLGRAGVELQERVQAAPTWDERFDVVDEVLGRLLRSGDGVAPQVSAAWRLLVASGGSAAVGSVAAEVGWSRRHLAARFRADEDYGSRGFTVCDPEGNLWSFGTYAGEA